MTSKWGERRSHVFVLRVLRNSEIHDVHEVPGDPGEGMAPERVPAKLRLSGKECTAKAAARFDKCKNCHFPPYATHFWRLACSQSLQLAGTPCQPV